MGGRVERGATSCWGVEEKREDFWSCCCCWREEEVAEEEERTEAMGGGRPAEATVLGRRREGGAASEAWDWGSIIGDRPEEVEIDMLPMGPEDWRTSIACG